jgi:hypothetical protein
MAKILLKNNRPHQITINYDRKQIHVPPSTVKYVREGDRDIEQVQVGQVEADSEIVEAAIKKSDVVANYFKSGWLTKEMTAKPVAA